MAATLNALMLPGQLESRAAQTDVQRFQARRAAAEEPYTQRDIVTGLESREAQTALSRTQRRRIEGLIPGEVAQQGYETQIKKTQVDLTNLEKAQREIALKEDQSDFANRVTVSFLDEEGNTITTEMSATEYLKQKATLAQKALELRREERITKRQQEIDQAKEDKDADDAEYTLLQDKGKDRPNEGQQRILANTFNTLSRKKYVYVPVVKRGLSGTYTVMEPVPIPQFRDAKGRLITPEARWVALGADEKGWTIAQFLEWMKGKLQQGGTP